MGTVTNLNNVERADRSLSLRHAFLVYTRPGALFSRVEDTGAYGWALVTLVVFAVLLGYAEVQTGLIDRTVDLQTETEQARLEESQAHLLDRIELRDRMDEMRKGGEFNKLLARLGAIVFTPTYLLGSFLLIASLFYALVALTGRKPEYHTLMSICVHSGFIVLAGYLVRLAMVMYYETTSVDTSLGMLVTPSTHPWLSAIDPFRIWFWVLVAMGLTVTRQLSRRMAVVTCLLMGLLATAARAAMAYELFGALQTA